MLTDDDKIHGEAKKVERDAEREKSTTGKRHAHFWLPCCQIQIIYNINFSRIYFFRFCACCDCAENSINCDTIARLAAADQSKRECE